jgi:hypothetical protein
MADVTVAVELKGDKKAASDIGNAIGEGASSILRKLGFGAITTQVQKATASVPAGAGGFTYGKAIAGGVAAGMAMSGMTAIIDSLKDMPVVVAIMKIFKIILLMLLMPLIPILKPIMTKLADFAKSFMGWVKANPEPAAGMAGMAVGGIIGASLGKMLGGVVGETVGALIGAAVGLSFGAPPKTSVEDALPATTDFANAIDKWVTGFNATLPDLNLLLDTYVYLPIQEWFSKFSWEPITKAWASFWNKLAEGVDTLVNVLKEGVNSVVRTVNKWLGTSFKELTSTVTSGGMSFTTSPAFAEALKAAKKGEGGTPATPSKGYTGIPSIVPWGNIKGWQLGGTVPATGMYMLHKGEEITSATKAGKGKGIISPTININIDRPSIRDDRDIKELVKQINFEQQRAMRRYVSYV